MSDVETIVIGAGVIGLAIARKLSQQQEVYVLEQEQLAGQHSSSHNSGVIHSGIYYPSSWLKTTLCIEGRKLLYQYCDKHNIAVNKLGKLVVAVDAQEQEALDLLAAKANSNNVPFRKLDNSQLAQHANYLNAQSALLFEQTGIIDSAQYLQQLEADIQHNGSQVLYQQQVEHTQYLSPQRFQVTVNGEQISCKNLIIATGIFGHKLALGEHIPTSHLCKGHYYRYQGSHPFKQLVYPLPQANNKGLGIHATLDTEGFLRFGPDTYHNCQLNYQFESNNKAAFFKAITRYWPDAEFEKLQADSIGIRAQLSPTTQAHDFMIQTASTHHMQGLVQLFGIESPGLTASLAIAEYVANHLEQA